ncbi:MAG: hypothetical protein ACMXYG_03635 [Candidatus Woesearchaeota archaeon]
MDIQQNQNEYECKLVEYVIVARRSGFNDSQIIRKFQKNNIPENTINKIMNISLNGNNQNNNYTNNEQSINNEDYEQNNINEEYYKDSEQISVTRQERSINSQPEQIQSNETENINNNINNNPSNSINNNANDKLSKDNNNNNNNKSKLLNKENYDRDKDTFTPEEFEELEKKENKGKLSNIFKNKSNNNDQNKKEGLDNFYINYNSEQISKEIHHLQSEIEQENINEGKLEGKIDIISQKNKDIQEEIDRIQEKVGELRSTVIGRERMFNKLEEDFSTVKYIVNTFKPEIIEKKFSDSEQNSMKVESRLEKIDLQIKNLNNKLNEYSELMKGIKDYENVIRKLEDIKKEEKNIEKIKIDVEKKGSKIEIISQNLQDSIKKINQIDLVSNNNKSSINEMMVSLAKIEKQNEFLVKKEDFEKLKSDIQIIKKVVYDKEINKIIKV